MGPGFYTREEGREAARLYQEKHSEPFKLADWKTKLQYLDLAQRNLWPKPEYSE